MAVLPAQRSRAFAHFWLLLLLPLFLFLTGCSKQEVYGSLSEAQANELIAALTDAGITSAKSNADGKWSVSVSQGDFSKAVVALRSAGLPREEQATLGEVFKKTGFNSTPLEERARLNFGLSQELQRTISLIDGVVQARVHLTMPEINQLSRETKPSAASVFVKYRSGFDVRRHTGEIKSIVTNSIEGLTYEKVSVFMDEAKSVAPIKSADSVIGWDMMTRIIVALGALALLLFAGRAMIKRRRAAGTKLPAKIDERVS